MKNVLLKDTFKEIKNTFKRFLSILIIVLLGVGFFAGIKAASPDMKKTIDKYYDEQNVMDLQMISTLGLTNQDIEELSKIAGIEKVSGGYAADVKINDGKEEVIVKLEALTLEVNQLVVIEGRLPEKKEECVVEESFLKGSNYQIGDIITIEAEDITNAQGEKQALLHQNQMTIVGTVKSPLYISRERGSTKLGSGKINYYVIIPIENFNTDYYTTAYITLKETKNLLTDSEVYKEKIEDVKKKIEEIEENRKQARYQEIYEQANQKIQEAQKELNEQKEKAEKSIQNAQKQILQAKQEVTNGKTELTKKTEQAQNQFKQAESKLQQAKQELNQKEKLFETEKEKANQQIEETKIQLQTLQNVQSKYQLANNNLREQEKNLQNLQEELSKLDPITQIEEIRKVNEQIIQTQNNITIAKETIQQIEEQLNEQGIEVKNLESMIQTIQTKIETGEAELTKNENLLVAAKAELQKQEKTLQTAKNTTNLQLNTAKEQLETAEKEIRQNEKVLANSDAEANERIEEAQKEIEQAKEKLSDIQKPEWYILDRNQNVGYVSYLQDTDRIANIAKVFPIVFFLVAALISLTSMTRMVEEQRVQIGTLKALGYSKRKIASKYIIYATLATIAGGMLGLIIGFSFLPKIIFDMYSMMYQLPSIILEFNITYAVTGMLAAIACTVGAALISCIKELHSTPASLMIPKAPKPGKRVLVEKISFIWSKLNFTKKVTMRNLFRYKKRFLMTIIGVAGCTSLIIAGFGLRDAISYMIPLQYENVFKYNLQVSFQDDTTITDIQAEYEKIMAISEITSGIKANMQSIEIVKNDNKQSIQLVVPENTDNISDFINLQSRTKKNEKYNMDEKGVIITEKLAKLLDIKVGDNIIIKNTDNVEAKVYVAHITENYLMHYIYMSPQLYKQTYKQDAKSNVMFAVTNELSKQQEETIGKTILEDKDTVTNVSFTTNTKSIFEDVMDNMNFVVWILIGAAGLLALVVLYNLSNTNISERIRELATIKVLGFYDKEVYNYIAKETIILTTIGILLGLLGGYVLTIYIIKTCELDTLMFDPNVRIMSYIYGIAITAIFAGIVNVGTYFSLKKINMIESLKSVE